MKKNNGITMIVLVITIVILLIIAGISINSGEKVIKESELENIKTNMLLIKGKAKGYVESANFDLGVSIDKNSEEEKNKKIEKAKSELKGTEITDSKELKNINITSENLQENNLNYSYYYKLSTKDLEELGLQNVKSDNKKGWYIVKYDMKNVEIEVYNTLGFEKDNKTYYSLTEIQDL